MNKLAEFLERNGGLLFLMAVLLVLAILGCFVAAWRFPGDEKIFLLISGIVTALLGSLTTIIRVKSSSIVGTINSPQEVIVNEKDKPFPPKPQQDENGGDPPPPEPVDPPTDH